MFFFQDVKILVGILNHPKTIPYRFSREMDIRPDRITKAFRQFLKLKLIVKEKRDERSNFIILTEDGKELALLFKDILNKMNKIGGSKNADTTDIKKN
jgi:DNA-binding MarR family transcriptional regulator